MRFLKLAPLFLALAISPAFGQAFTGPATITQPTTPGDCVKVDTDTQSPNNLLDTGSPCGAGSGGVTSFNMRTGAVVPATNDYTFSQIGSLPTTLSGYGITDGVSLTGTQALTNKTYNGMSITGNTGTLAIGNAKVATISNTLTFAGTDGSTLNIGAGGTLGSNAFTSTAYAPLASPGLTGTPTAPTPSAPDNSTTIATTAFVKAQGYSTAVGANPTGSITGPASNGSAPTFLRSDAAIPLGTITQMVVVNLNVANPPASVTGSAIQFNGANGVNSFIENNSFGATPGLLQRRADGTNASPTAVQSGEILANLGARPYDGSAYASASTGSIQAIAIENFTTSAHGTYVLFNCTAITTLMTAECGRVTSTGFQGALGATTPSTIAGTTLSVGTSNLFTVSLAGAVVANAQTTIALADALTNTVGYSTILNHTTSGTVAAGFGTGIRFNLPSAAGTIRDAFDIETTLTTATDAAEAGSMKWYGVSGGTAHTLALTLSAAGALTAPGTVSTGANFRSTITGGVFSIGSANDVILSRAAAATWQFGAADVDTGPVAQTLRFQGPLVGGTSNVAGPNTTIIGTLGKGSANSGDIIIQTGGAVGASGTTIATATTALTIKGVTQIVNFAAGVVMAPNGGDTVTLGAGNWQFTNTLLAGNTGGVALYRRAVSSTVPGYAPNGNDSTTGIGAQASGNMSMIVGGSEKTRFTSTDLLVFAFINPSTASTPTAGSGAASVTGNDQKFVVTSGTAQTSVTVNFGHTWTATPVCTIGSGATASVIDISSVSTTAITFGASVALTATPIQVLCF